MPRALTGAAVAALAGSGTPAGAGPRCISFGAKGRKGECRRDGDCCEGVRCVKVKGRKTRRCQACVGDRRRCGGVCCPSGEACFDPNEDVCKAP